MAKLTLNEPRFVLKNLPGQPDTTTFSQFLAAVKRLVGPSDTTKSAPFDFQIADVALRNGHFAIEKADVPRAPTYGQSIDYDHLVVDSIYADISNIRLGDTLRMRISQLHAVETPSQTQLREITADMTYGPHFWEFKDLSLRVGRSQIKDYVRFEFRVFGNFTDYNDSMKTIAHLRNSQGVFATTLPSLRPQLTGHARVGGAFGRCLGLRARFQGEQPGRALRHRHPHCGQARPRRRPAQLQGKLHRPAPAALGGGDQRPEKVAARPRPTQLVQRLGTVKLQGQVLGFYNDFVANASFDTALGFVATDVNLKTKTDLTHAVYAGTVRSNAFQLGKFLGDESVIRDVTLNGRVAGVGFLPPSARGQAKLTVPSIWLNGYRYHNITLNGDFHQQAFNGHITAQRPGRAPGGRWPRRPGPRAPGRGHQGQN